MSLDIPAALENGFMRLPTRVAGLLFVAFLAIGIASTVTAQTLSFAVMDAVQQSVQSGAATPTVPPTGTGTGTAALALDVGLPIAVVLFLTQLVISQIVSIVAVRTFVSDARRTFPTGVTRRLPWVILNTFVASFIVSVLVGIGIVLLVIPGIYLAVALYFVQFEVIVEERNAIDALREGWEVTKGNRLGVFLLLVIILAIGLVSAIPSFVLGFAGVSPLITGAVGVLIGAVASIISVAIGARAYVQLKPDSWSSDFDTPDPFSY